MYNINIKDLKMKIEPLGNRVLIEPIPEEDTSKGGIYIPDNAKEKPMKGIVINVGPGYFDNNGNIIPCGVTEGDIVLYNKYIGIEIPNLEDETKKLLLISERELLAIVKE